MTLTLDKPTHAPTKISRPAEAMPPPNLSNGVEPAAYPRGPTLMRFTPEQFCRMDELGLLPKRTELVDGEILLMAATQFYHPLGLERTRNRLQPRWSEPRLLFTQATHYFPSGWMPMPDIALYDAFSNPNGPWPLPRLIIEIADTTLACDLGNKRLRYAREGVPEYWVADISRRRFLIFRDPIPDAASAVEAWRTEVIVGADGEVSPLCIPDLAIKVADVLPEPPADAGE